MTVIQETFDIPEEIYSKLSIGEYTRSGGVVRWNVGSKKGQIVTHLKPVDLAKTKQGQEPKRLGAQIINVVEENRKVFIIGAAIIGAATVGNIIYRRLTNHKTTVVDRFKINLYNYLDAISKGNLQIEIIDTLMDSLENIKTDKDYEQYKIELSKDGFDNIVNWIYDYTKKLAGNNEVHLNEKECIKTENSITNLQNYLETQKRIFLIKS